MAGILDALSLEEETMSAFQLKSFRFPDLATFTFDIKVRTLYSCISLEFYFDDSKLQMALDELGSVSLVPISNPAGVLTSNELMNQKTSIDSRYRSKLWSLTWSKSVHGNDAYEMVPVYEMECVGAGKYDDRTWGAYSLEMDHCRAGDVSFDATLVVELDDKGTIASAVGNGGPSVLLNVLGADVLMVDLERKNSYVGYNAMSPSQAASAALSQVLLNTSNSIAWNINIISEPSTSLVVGSEGQFLEYVDSMKFKSYSNYVWTSHSDGHYDQKAYVFEGEQEYAQLSDWSFAVDFRTTPAPAGQPLTFRGPMAPHFSNNPIAIMGVSQHAAKHAEQQFLLRVALDAENLFSNSVAYHSGNIYTYYSSPRCTARFVVVLEKDELPDPSVNFALLGSEPNGRLGWLYDLMMTAVESKLSQRLPGAFNISSTIVAVNELDSLVEVVAEIKFPEPRYSDLIHNQMRNEYDWRGLKSGYYPYGCASRNPVFNILFDGFEKAFNPADTCKSVRPVAPPIYNPEVNFSSWKRFTGLSNSTEYSAIAASSDLCNMTVVGNGPILTSSDCGVTWIARSREIESGLGYVAMSGDGKYQLASPAYCLPWEEGCYPSPLLRSDNYGTTWNYVGESAHFRTLSISKSGVYQAASDYADYAGDVRLSADYGLTWASMKPLGGQFWYSVSLSESGWIAAWTDSGSTFYESLNRGKIWISVTVPELSLNFGAISADGKYQIAAQSRAPGDGGGNFYVSSNFGKSWMDVAESAQGYSCLAVSQSGRVMIAAGSKMFVSFNYGITFESTQLLDSCRSVVISTDEMKIAVLLSNGELFSTIVAVTSPAPTRMPTPAPYQPEEFFSDSPEKRPAVTPQSTETPTPSHPKQFSMQFYSPEKRPAVTSQSTETPTPSHPKQFSMQFYSYSPGKRPAVTPQPTKTPKSPKNCSTSFLRDAYQESSVISASFITSESRYGGVLDGSTSEIFGPWYSFASRMMQPVVNKFRCSSTGLYQLNHLANELFEMNVHECGPRGVFKIDAHVAVDLTLDGHISVAASEGGGFKAMQEVQWDLRDGRRGFVQANNNFSIPDFDWDIRATLDFAPAGPVGQYALDIDLHGQKPYSVERLYTTSVTPMYAVTYKRMINIIAPYRFTTRGGGTYKFSSIESWLLTMNKWMLVSNGKYLGSVDNGTIGWLAAKNGHVIGAVAVSTHDFSGNSNSTIMLHNELEWNLGSAVGGMKAASNANYTTCRASSASSMYTTKTDEKWDLHAVARYVPSTEPFHEYNTRMMGGEMIAPPIKSANKQIDMHLKMHSVSNVVVNTISYERLPTTCNLGIALDNFDNAFSRMPMYQAYFSALFREGLVKYLLHHIPSAEISLSVMRSVSWYIQTNNGRSMVQIYAEFSADSTVCNFALQALGRYDMGTSTGDEWCHSSFVKTLGCMVFSPAPSWIWSMSYSPDKSSFFVSIAEKSMLNRLADGSNSFTSGVRTSVSYYWGGANIRTIRIATEDVVEVPFNISASLYGQYNDLRWQEYLLEVESVVLDYYPDGFFPSQGAPRRVSMEGMIALEASNRGYVRVDADVHISKGATLHDGQVEGLKAVGSAHWDVHSEDQGFLYMAANSTIALQKGELRSGTAAIDVGFQGGLKYVPRNYSLKAAAAAPVGLDPWNAAPRNPFAPESPPKIVRKLQSGLPKPTPNPTRIPSIVVQSKAPTPTIAPTRAFRPWVQPFAFYSHLEAKSHKFRRLSSAPYVYSPAGTKREIDLMVDGIGAIGKNRHKAWYMDVSYGRLAVDEKVVFLASASHDKDTGPLNGTVYVLPFAPSRTTHPTLAPLQRPTLRPTMRGTYPTMKPVTVKPTRIWNPSPYPTLRPTLDPTGQPTGYPSSQPIGNPTSDPSSQPTSSPTLSPTGQPSRRPSSQPSGQPSRIPSSQPSAQPSRQPTVQPSSQPTRQPTAQPSSQPTRQPTGQPSRQPISKPTSQPSCQPTGQPTRQPSSRPSGQPTRQPSSQPTRQPSRQPSSQPSKQPTAEPTVFWNATLYHSRRPSGQPTSSPTCPTGQPSRKPSGQPTKQPVAVPTGQPSMQPTMQPSSQPSLQPSSQPSRQPTSQPSRQPTGQPTIRPSAKPSSDPSSQPTTQPSRIPTGQPSRMPSGQPSGKPTRNPSSQPSGEPTLQPSMQPSRQPSSQPSRQPTGQPSRQPVASPTRRPNTGVPSGHPSGLPSAQPTSEPSSFPTGQPSRQPTRQPSSQPSSQPSRQPTRQPTGQPSRQPTGQPSRQPTGQPSAGPTVQPTSQPSRQPTGRPSRQPTRQPTSQPTSRPTCLPTRQPSSQPSAQPSRRPTRVNPTLHPTPGKPSGQPTSSPTSPSGQPSRQPTRQPSGQPTRQPSSQPSSQPSGQPSSQPTMQPSRQPTGQPSRQPTRQPSGQPSRNPSGQPSSKPTMQPTGQPSRQPTSQPSSQPSRQPTGQPSRQPTRQPTGQPSRQPTGQPSHQPSSQPTGSPTRQPSSQPSRQPSRQPTGQPSHQPTGQPTRQPTRQPTAQPSRQPTRQPSGQPSRQPISKPTGQPSSQPTGFSGYATDSVWRLFNRTTATNQLDTQAVSYGSFVYKDMYSYVVNGNARTSALDVTQGGALKDLTKTHACPAWKKFASQTLRLPFDNVFFDSVTVTGMNKQFSKASGRAGVIFRNVTSYTCTSSDHKSGAVKQIADFIASPKSDGKIKIDCDGNSWVVQKCSSTLALCVNCELNNNDICSETGSKITDEKTCWGAKVNTKDKPTYPAVFMNPCQNNCKPVQRISSSSFSIKFKASLIPMYPQFNSLRVSSTTKTSITVSSNTSVAGNIFCAPFFGGALPKSLADIRSAGFSAQSLAPNAASSISIAPLEPQTNMSIYCATSNFQAQEMDLATVMKTGTIASAATDCCRGIVWDATTRQQKEANSSTNPSTLTAFKYTLQAAPRTLTTIQHILEVSASPACNFTNPSIAREARAMPAQSTFRPNSAKAYSGSFVVIGTPGCYYVNLAIAVGGTNYSVPSRAPLNIQSAISQPADPFLTAAEFSSNGASLIVQLDSRTDKGQSFARINNGYNGYSLGSNFNCSTMLQFNGAAMPPAVADSLGSIVSASRPPVCLWKSDSQIFVRLFGSRVLPGDTLRLRATRLKPCPLSFSDLQCQALKYATKDSSIAITASPNTVRPSVNLVASTVVGGCDDIKIDALSTSGNAGRPWAGMEWTVAATPPADTTDSTMDANGIASYLNNQYGVRNFTSSINKYVIIPGSARAGAATLLKAGVLSISLKLTNFLGAVSMSTVTVTIKDDWMPSGSIDGASIVTLATRASPLRLRARADLPSCVTASRNFSMSYAWKVYEGLISQGVASVSRDPRLFSIPAYSLKLQAAKEYTMVATSAPSDPRYSDRSVSSSVTVQVGRGPLSTLIVEYDVSTGTRLGYIISKTIWTSAIVKSTTPVTLKAAVYDIDWFSNNYYFVPGATTLFSYSWSCYKSYPYSLFGNDCELGIQMSSTYASNDGTASPYKLDIPVAYFKTITVARVCLMFKLSVKESIQGVEKAASNSFELCIRSDAVPQILSSPVKAKYNANEKITIDAMVTVVGSPATVLWTSSASSLNSTLLSKVTSVSSLTSVISSRPQSYSQIFELPIKPNSLQPGVTYTFVLSAQYSSSQVSTSEFKVLINSPPVGGSVEVLSTTGGRTGTAIVTPFIVKTFDWLDDATDYPLSYILTSYGLADRSDAVILKPLSQVSLINTTFPLGLATNAFKIYCIAIAQDSLGGAATSSATYITVTKPSTAALSNGVTIALAAGKTAGDSSAVLAVASAVASVLNSAKCGTMNEATCSKKYNRAGCKATANTCGRCLVGYDGVQKDSNTACIKASSKKRRRLLESDSESVSGQIDRKLLALSMLHESCNPVNDGQDCITGYCYNATSPTTGECRERIKSCPDGCSGRGSCIYRDSEGGPIADSACTEQNGLCRATCSCNSGWHGSACSLNATEYSISASIIDTLCSASLTASLTEEVTADIVQQQSNAVSYVLSDPELLSNGALQNCSLMLINSIASFPAATAADAETTDLVLDALNTVMQRPERLSASLLMMLQNATMTLTDANQAKQNFGELPLQLIREHMRVQTQVLRPDQLQQGSLTMSLPRTAYEEARKKPLTTVTVQVLNSSVLSSLTGVGVSIASYTNNPSKLRTNISSTPVSIRLSAYSTAVSADSNAAPIGMRRFLLNGEDSMESSGSLAQRPFEGMFGGPGSESVRVSLSERGDAYSSDASLLLDLQPANLVHELTALAPQHHLHSHGMGLVVGSGGHHASSSDHRFRRLSSELSKSTSYNVTITLQHAKNMTGLYKKQTPVTIQKLCTGSGATIVLPRGCGHTAANYTCSEYGIFKYTCKTSSFEPTCLVQGTSGDFSEQKSVCRRVAYDATTTTCQCTVAPAAIAGRRLAADTQSSDTTLAVVAQGTASDTPYDSTFTKGPPPSAVPTTVPTAAPTSIVSTTVTISMTGPTLAQIQSPPYQKAVRKAVSVSLGNLSMEYISNTTSTEKRRQLREVQLEKDSGSTQRQLASLSVSVIIQAPSSALSSYPTLPAITLQLANTLASNLNKQVAGMQLAGITITGMVTANNSPTFAPTQLPSQLPTLLPPATPEAEKKGGDSGSGAEPGAAIGGALAGIAIVGALGYYWYARKSETKSKIAPGDDVVFGRGGEDVDFDGSPVPGSRQASSRVHPEGLMQDDPIKPGAGSMFSTNIARVQPIVEEPVEIKAAGLHFGGTEGTHAPKEETSRPAPAHKQTHHGHHPAPKPSTRAYTEKEKALNAQAIVNAHALSEHLVEVDHQNQKSEAKKKLDIKLHQKRRKNKNKRKLKMATKMLISMMGGRKATNFDFPGNSGFDDEEHDEDEDAVDDDDEGEEGEGAHDELYSDVFDDHPPDHEHHHHRKHAHNVVNNAIASLISNRVLALTDTVGAHDELYSEVFDDHPSDHEHHHHRKHAHNVVNNAIASLISNRVLALTDTVHTPAHDAVEAILSEDSLHAANVEAAKRAAARRAVIDEDDEDINFDASGSEEGVEDRDAGSARSSPTEHPSAHSETA